MLLHEAFDLALERFVAEGPDRRVDLLATYGRRRLRPMMLDALARLRSAGRPLDLRPAERRDLAPAADRGPRRRDGAGGSREAGRAHRAA